MLVGDLQQRHIQAVEGEFALALVVNWKTVQMGRGIDGEKRTRQFTLTCSV